MNQKGITILEVLIVLIISLVLMVSLINLTKYFKRNHNHVDNELEKLQDISAFNYYILENLDQRSNTKYYLINDNNNEWQILDKNNNLILIYSHQDNYLRTQDNEIIFKYIIDITYEKKEHLIIFNLIFKEEVKKIVYQWES